MKVSPGSGTGPGTVPPFLKDPMFDLAQGALTEETPRLLRALIRLLSANVKVSDEAVDRIRGLAAEGPVVFAMKYRSFYDLHFLRMRFGEIGGLPLPAYVFSAPAIAEGSLTKVTRIWGAKLRYAMDRTSRYGAVDQALLQTIAENGGALVMHLVDEETFSDRYVNPEFDPLQTIIDLQGRVRGCVSILPIYLLYDSSARQAIRPVWDIMLGDFDRPGLLRRIQSRIRKWTVPELLVGEPVRLLEEMEEFGSDQPWEELPFVLRKRLIAAINSRIRVTRGPEVLSRTEMEERVLRDPRVEASVSELVSSSGFSVEKARGKARDYFKEIAAVQHGQFHHVLYHVLGWTFTGVFDGIDLRHSDLVALKEANTRYSLVFVPCHKSHFDYLLLGFICFINQMMIPYIAAGTNLSFWPVGFILRNVGAFFIRRTFHGEKFYAHVFKAYLDMLVREKINIKFYMEGGRSRTGKLLKPRVGMLSFLLQTVEEGTVEDLYFVPVYVGYDQIPEENSYLRELAGREKKKESLREMLRVRRIFKRRYGKVYIRFSEPVSFRDFCKGGEDACPGPLSGDPGTSGPVTAIDKRDRRERRALHDDFANHLMYGIVRAGVVSPVELTAAGLTCAGEGRVSHECLREALLILTTALDDEGIELSERAKGPVQAIEAAIPIFRDRGFVEIEQSDGEHREVCYVLNERSRPNMVFYRNSLMNYLWPASVLAIVLLSRPVFYKSGRPESLPHDERQQSLHQELMSECGFLVQLFSKEIVVDPKVSEGSRLNQAFDLFLRTGWVGVPQPGSAVSDLDRRPLEILRGIVGDLLETYFYAMAAVEKMEPDTKVPLAGFVKTSLGVAQELVRACPAPRSGEPRTPGPGDQAKAGGTPVISSLAVAGALTRLTEMGILDYRPSRKVIQGVSDRERLHALRVRLGDLLGFDQCEGAEIDHDDTEKTNIKS